MFRSRYLVISVSFFRPTFPFPFPISAKKYSNGNGLSIFPTVPDRFQALPETSALRVPEALGKALKTLGKGFAECHTRQRRLGKQCIGKAFFAEYFFSGTRQRGLSSARQRKAAITATG
jgi:hypothetical protein